jgi:hypothetical protein
MSGILGTSVTGAGGASAYTIDNSLRFRSSASANLRRTPTVTSNQRTWTWSAWVKRGSLTSDQMLFSVSNTYIRFGNGSFDTLWLNLRGTGGTNYFFQTTQVFRDPAAWYHIVLAVDTTQATASNRVKLYSNGVQITNFTTYADYPPQNTDTAVNSTTAHTLGSYSNNSIYFDGYMTEVNLIDGQQLTPSSFGSTNASTGVWQPKAYTGTYGTNGFYLPFSNQSTATYAGSFNGSNQFLSVAQNAAFSFGTGDFTVEAWVYANSWNSVNPIIALGDGAVGGGSPVYSGWVMRYDSSNGIIWYRNDTGGETSLVSNATLQANQWNHIAISRSSGVLKMFANGVQVYSAANTVSYNNVNSDTLKIGGNWRIGGGVVTWTNGLISNTRIVKGTGLYTANFVPSKVPLTAVSGTSLLTLQNASIVDNSPNAFTITNNNSVSTSVQNPFAATGIAADQSGNANNWTTSNISLAAGVTYDSMTDSPTPSSDTVGNFCTWNAVGTYVGTPTDGNLKISATSAGANGTMGASSGKFYWETVYTAIGSDEGVIVGIRSTDSIATGAAENVGYYGGGSENGKKIINGGGVSAYGATWTTGDVIGVALDLDGGTITFYKNNVSQGPISFTVGGKTWTSFNWRTGPASGVNTGTINYGQQPFVYTPPAGFKRLQTFNLATPTIGASSTTLANKYMDATLYTGTGANQTITNSGSMQPDLVWVKVRSQTGTPVLTDSVRGANKQIFSNLANSEASSTIKITGFTSSGFTLGADNGTGTGDANFNGQTYVGWQWRANSGTNVTNTAGSITSTVSANTTAGFSVVAYTLNNSTFTVGHGLGAVPRMIIVKNLDTTNNWDVYTATTGAGTRLQLNSTATPTSTTQVWNNTTPTSTVFSGNSAWWTNPGTSRMVAYCFAQIAGYSAINSYTGNGSSDGPFIYTGFRPRWIMVKRYDSSSGADWGIQDTAMSPNNVSASSLAANDNRGQIFGFVADINSNGFKIRSTDSICNASGGTYIYIAFAENPFNYSLAR